MRRYPVNIKSDNSKISICHPCRIKSQNRKNKKTKENKTKVVSRLLLKSIENIVETTAITSKIVNGKLMGVLGIPVLVLIFQIHHIESRVRVRKDTVSDTGGKVLLSPNWRISNRVPAKTLVLRNIFGSDLVNLLIIFM